MPLYEYQCSECKERIEVLQKFSDPVLTKCSICGGELERVLSVPSIRFKGSGWYVTDYSGRSNSNGHGGKTAGSESGDTSSEKKTPAAKSKTEQADSSKGSSK